MNQKKIEYDWLVLVDMPYLRSLAEPTEDDERHLDAVLARAEVLRDELEKDRVRAEKAEMLERFAADPRNTLEPATTDFYVTRTATRDIYDFDREDTGKDLNSRALAAIEGSSARVEDFAKENATRLVERRADDAGMLARHVLAHDAPAYQSAFAKLMRGKSQMLTGDEQAALARAQTVGSNAEGGFMLPTLVDPTIVLTNDGTVNPIRGISRVEPIVGRNQWNGVTSAGVTASYDAESSEVSDDSFTVAQPSINARKAQVFVPFSIEAEQDISSLTSEITALFADAKDRLESNKFVLGNGDASSEPLGVVFAVSGTTTSRVAATTDNSFGLVDVYATLEGLAARHRPNASWVANLSIVNDIRQFGTANNYHGYLTDLAGDSPRQLLGKPLYESSEMDGAIGTGNDDILLIGDFTKYVIVDRVGFAVELVPHLLGSSRRPNGTRGWYGYWRNGAEPIDLNAFRILRV